MTLSGFWKGAERREKKEGEGCASLLLMKEKLCCNYQGLPNVCLLHSSDISSFYSLDSHSLLSLQDKVPLRHCGYLVDLIEGLTHVKASYADCVTQ